MPGVGEDRLVWWERKKVNDGNSRSKCKERIRRVLSSRSVSPPPFIPFLRNALATFSQVSVQELYTDPTRLSNCHEACQKLFGYDGIVPYFDSTLEAEACGCQVEWDSEGSPSIKSPIMSNLKDIGAVPTAELERRGRLPVAIETMRRLNQTIGRSVGLFPSVTGPITLACFLRGPELWHDFDEQPDFLTEFFELVGAIIVKIVRLYCESGADSLFIVDDEISRLESRHFPVIHACLRTVRNVANFYGARVILVARKVTTQQLPHFFQIPMDGLCLGDYSDISELVRLGLPKNVLTCASIPTSAFLEGAERVQNAVQKILESGRAKAYLMTTEWEVPGSVEASALHEVRNTLLNHGN